MGKKLSVVKSVKSEDYTAPGNAVNEIWVGDTELISRLPFGDNDMEQAGWPANGGPKIPWHNFIIPMRRDLGTPSVTNSSPPLDFSVLVSQVPLNQMICCHQGGCITDQGITNTVFTFQLVAQDNSRFQYAVTLMILAYMGLISCREGRRLAAVLPSGRYIPYHDPTSLWAVANSAAAATILNACALVLGVLAISAWYEAHRVYRFETDDWRFMENLATTVLSTQMMVTSWTILVDWLDVWRILRHRNCRRGELPMEITINIRDEPPHYSPQNPPAAPV
ncbi:uncharacterized protein DSM5745_08095 [Aspergillus mulundensis]|uniref:Uncharacterized protein n=1 Tax=Aspergillus mulundensis TaxID=1810919 RepID=A0A3D8R9P6_9EURO|nr:hypothetical protein DSM5745_08095 [Aspergillus mulundensis]RDW70584.1 hypothetical protein DSM5745_08095 [Aspergillus mulundensis]